MKKIFIITVLGLAFTVHAADKVRVKALTLKVGDEIIYKKKIDDKDGDLKTEHVGTIKKFLAGGIVVVKRKPCVLHADTTNEVKVKRNDIASIKASSCFKSICIGAAVTTVNGPSKVVGIFENGVYLIEENGELPGYLHKNAPFWRASYDKLMFPLNNEKSVGSEKRANESNPKTLKTNEENSEATSKANAF